jgi:hypothetical protein
VSLRTRVGRGDQIVHIQVAAHEETGRDAVTGDRDDTAIGADAGEPVAIGLHGADERHEIRAFEMRAQLRHGVEAGRDLVIGDGVFRHAWMRGRSVGQVVFDR